MLLAGCQGQRSSQWPCARWYQAASVVRIPAIGAGGIMSAEAVVFSIQIGTAQFAKSGVIPRVLDNFSEWLRRQGVTEVREVIDAARAESG